MYDSAPTILGRGSRGNRSPRNEHARLSVAIVIGFIALGPPLWRRTPRAAAAGDDSGRTGAGSNDSCGASGPRARHSGADARSADARLRRGDDAGRRRGAARRCVWATSCSGRRTPGARNDGAAGRSAGHDSQIHDGIDRQQDLSGHRPRARLSLDGRSERSGETDREQRSCALHAQSRGVRAAAIRGRHDCAGHRRRRRPGSDVVHDARQPHRAEARARR